METAKPKTWRSRRLVILGAMALGLVALALIASACSGPEGPAGAAGADGINAAATCSDCHDDTTLILSKHLQWEQQVHVTGAGIGYAGGRSGCAGCHGSEGFTARMAAGQDTWDEAIPNASPINCRTCHEIHTSYTKADFALTETAPVTIATSGSTFDMGGGNLCANCHQPRRDPAGVGFADGADVEITSTHWGPHHGTEATVLLGEGGFGVTGSPSAHYQLVDGGCPTCHMADGNHTLVATTAGCQTCHADLDTLDRNGVQTEVTALFEELGELLEHAGLLHDGHPVVGTYSEAQAGALWNYLTVFEDDSMGVHNSAYTKALLRAGIAALE
jgi:hypothetical protein